MAATSSAGTTLKIGTQDIGEVTQIKGPSESKKEIDVTAVNDTSRRRIAGLKDGGELTFDVNYDKADLGQTALRASWDAGTEASFLITLPGTLGTIAFNGVILKWEPKVDVDKAVGVSVQVRISGDVTYA